MLLLIPCRLVRPWLTLMLAALIAGVSGCGESGPARAAIEGQVTIGGRPLRTGRIIFSPLPPAEGSATSVAIVDGRYCAERHEGPLVGQNLVQVESDPELGFPLDDEQAFVSHLLARPLPFNPIPAQFGANSQLRVEVKADEENQFDIPMPAASY